MCQSKLLSYECFTPKISLLGRTQCQEFDCLYRAKRYGQPCNPLLASYRGALNKFVGTAIKQSVHKDSQLKITKDKNNDISP